MICKPTQAFSAIALFGVVGAFGAAQGADKGEGPLRTEPAIAVFELGTKDVGSAEASLYADVLSVALHRTGATVVDRSRREDALREIEFSSGDAADAVPLRAGRLLAATHVVTGSVGLYDGNLVVSLRLVETETGKVAGSYGEMYDDFEEAMDDAGTAAGRLASALSRGREGGSRHSSESGNVGAPAFGAVGADDFLDDLEPSSPPRWFPFQLSIAGPVQLVPRGTAIVGFGVGLVAASNSRVTGAFVAPVSFIDEALVGAQIGVLHTAGTVVGAQVGVAGFAERVLILQMNAVYNGASRVRGCQIGVVNNAEKCEGVQVGVVNMAGMLRGVQVGLVNVVRYGDWAGFMPFLNIRL